MVFVKKSILDVRKELRDKKDDVIAVQMGCSINNYDAFRSYFKVLDLLVIALALATLLLGLILGGI